MRINKEDFVVGRIYQRILEKMQTTDCGFTIEHGIERTVDVGSVIEKLFEILPDIKVTLKSLSHGYSMIINKGD